MTMKIHENWRFQTGFHIFQYRSMGAQIADVAVELMPLGNGIGEISSHSWHFRISNGMTYQFHGKSRALIWNIYIYGIYMESYGSKPHMVVSWNRGTPINHPSLDWDFPWNKPSSYWGSPLFENPPYFSVLVIQDGAGDQPWESMGKT